MKTDLESLSPTRVKLTVEQVRQFLQQMNEQSEFDDIELDPIALTAIAGGRRRLSAC